MGKKPTPKELAEEQRASGKDAAALAKLLKKAGAKNLSAARRRDAATHNVVARYYESGRCQLGHKNCTAEDH
jgi:hypothetical protein